MLLESFDTSLPADVRKSVGAFYTPYQVVSLLHDMILKHALWFAQECVVYDPAAGTGNLIRPFPNPGRVVASSILDEEVKILRSLWDKSSKVDFLNDSLPLDLLTALRFEQKLLWVMNPPYEACSGSKINREMKELGLGKAATYADTQFLYKAIQESLSLGLTDCYIAVIMTRRWLSSDGFCAFQEWVLERASIVSGFVVNAGIFGLSSAWAPICLLLKVGEGESRMQFPVLPYLSLDELDSNFSRSERVSFVARL